MAVSDPLRYARQAASTLLADLEDRLVRIDKYARGEQDYPYTPDHSDEEYVQLAKKSITNVFPFLLGTPRQMMKGDSFRRGTTSVEQPTLSEAAVQAVQPEWDHWQRSLMDGKQAAIYEGALKFGHSFVWTYEDPKRGTISKGLSALKTVALYEDPANDVDPVVAFHVKRYASGKDPEAKGYKPGLAYLWDDSHKYEVTFESLQDTESFVIDDERTELHGASECPVTRFTAAVDLEGRTWGVVEPMFVLQDRINQTVFDLLIVQSYASFKVRTIAGLTLPVKMKPVDEDGNTITDPKGEDDERIFEWVVVTDKNGAPVYDEVNLNARRALIAEDHETRFGTLDETPLEGFIAAIELGFRHMAALSQTPPHHILGEISNLSAEALEAAELSLSRKVEEFKTSFGESWERVFRIAAQINDEPGADDFAGELIWRDQHNASLAQSADALGKLAQQLGVPARGLWHRIPNITANELAMFEKLRREEPAQALATAVTGAGASTRPSFRAQQPAPAQAESAA